MTCVGSLDFLAFVFRSFSFSFLVLFHDLISSVRAVWDRKTRAVWELLVTADVVSGNGIIIVT